MLISMTGWNPREEEFFHGSKIYREATGLRWVTFYREAIRSVFLLDAKQAEAVVPEIY
jgi:hypothetical protein